MMKVMTFLLVGLLVLAAAGRFYAEAQVRESEREIARLEERAGALTGEIEKVRLDVEVLESASRLSKLNSSRLALGTVRAEQLLDDQEFARVIGLPAEETHKESLVPANADIIGNAIGMADPALAIKAVGE